MNRFSIYLILAAAFLASCTKAPVENPAGDSICFRTDLIGVSESPLSKAEIDKAAGQSIYVTESHNWIFNSTPCPLPAGTGIYRTGQTWESGKEYNFFAYMYDGDDGVSGISDYGRRFTISQPATPSYDGSNSGFSDYLLSYVNYVADGAAKPLVTFGMVHATAAVELHFVKPEGAADTRVLSATMSGVSTSASYSVNDHTATNISWTVDRTDDKADYTRSGGNFTVPEIGADGSYFPDGSLYFSFLACQQPVDPVTIEVTFKVDGGSQYTVGFPLDQVEGVPNWMAGTKTRYAVVLDSEARLYGSIEDWKDGGEMEGSLVP